jgi:YfiH family protein
MRLKPWPAECVFAETARIFPGRRFVWLSQEHTRIVHRADGGREIAGSAGDGLVSGDPQTLIGVSVADCMPIFLWDTASGARAVLHSGWKGTGIVREALRLMREGFAAQAANVRAILGPGIRACCYAVPRERACAFAAEFGEDAGFSRSGAWYIDLAAANRNILAAEGVTHVYTHPECTRCDTRFSSFRRQGSGNFTRMLAVI